MLSAFSETAGDRLADARTGRTAGFCLVGMLRRRCSGSLRIRGRDDAERLRHDPAAGWIVGGKATSGNVGKPDWAFRDPLAHDRKEPVGARQSFGPMDRPGSRPSSATRRRARHGFERSHGEQELSVWNGHYECTCYHPLFVFNQFGDLERCALRPGNVHSADGWEGVLKPVLARYREGLAHLFPR